jgi:hypothetical protein
MNSVSSYLTWGRFQRRALGGGLCLNGFGDVLSCDSLWVVPGGVGGEQKALRGVGSMYKDREGSEMGRVVITTRRSFRERMGHAWQRRRLSGDIALLSPHKKKKSFYLSWTEF